MISLEKAKELIDDKNLSDEEVKEVRDQLESLADLMFDMWLEERNQKKIE